ncbi:MAG: T9SS type A sorting domain-containing protein [Pedobacter sp.]
MKKQILVFLLLFCSLTGISAKASPISPVNDDCSGAIPINTDAGTVSSVFSNLGATLSMPACSGSAGNDIWFKFTATASRHQVISRAINSARHIVEVFQGTCGNLTSILCKDSPNNTAELVNLVPGNTYYYRLYLGDGSTAATDFNTYITTRPIPINDEPAGAASVAINTTFNGSLEYATQSFAPCYNTGYEAKDVWYKFVATSTAHNFALSPVSFDESMFQVYSGTPGNLTSIFCSGVSKYEEIKTAALTNLKVGDTYFMRVYNRWGDASPSVTYKLDITTTDNKLANDDCSGAIDINTNTGTVSSVFSNLGATLSMPACSGSAGNDIWFRFTATASRHQVISRAINSARHIVEVFQGTCGNLTSILCKDSPNNTAELVNLVPGNTYYYRLYLRDGSTATTDFNTYITTRAIPANDETAGATSIAVNTTFNGSLEYATQSFAPCYDTGYEAKDVWYKFVATSTALSFALSPVSFDESMFQVYSGTPSNLTSIHCSEISGYQQIKTAALTNLKVGDTYYMRVYNRYGDASPSVTYRLDIKNVVLPMPTITSVIPLTAEAGTLVEIKGTAFENVLSVTFGGAPAIIMQVASAAITAQVPQRAKSGDIVVESAAGTAKISGFTFIPVPVLTASGKTTFSTGSNVVLSLTAGSGYTYKWYKDDVEIPGIYGTSLTVTEQGSYVASVVLNNVEVRSNAIHVTVVFGLPANNFTLQINGETCKTSNNGLVGIKAVQSMNYKAVITGNNLNDTYTFTTGLEIKNLPSGSYNICIYVEGQAAYKQCYDVVITEPKDLSVYSSVNLNTNMVDLVMQGGTSYIIDLNGKIYSTSESHLSLKLKNGSNQLKVSTEKDCQGVFSKMINAEGILVYPNPFDDELSISTTVQKASINIINLQGRVVFSQNVSSQDGTISINLSILSKGMYLLRFKSDGTESVHKIEKK